MKILGFVAAAVLTLIGPALAESAASDQPMVVAEEGGVSVRLGDRDHDRDARRHHTPIVVVREHDRDRHHDRDRDRHHDRDRDRDRDH